MTELAGLTKVAEGREAEMFAYGDGKILRVFRGGQGPQQAEYLALTLKWAGDAGIRVPAVYGREEADGRAAVIMERIDGVDLLTEMGRRPWKVFAIAPLCGRVQAQINSATAPPEAPDLRERLRQAILRVHEAAGHYADPALESLARLPGGERICHGDFHPANLMLDRGQPVVIDWTNLARGPAEADFARTRLMMRLGEPPPGTSLALRLLARFGRRIFLGLYERAYRSSIMVDDELLKRWEFPVAVARLADNIPEETDALMKFIASRAPGVTREA